MTEVVFEEGAVVQLKSGGPAMTYGGDDSIGRAICTWFDSKNNLQTRTFNKTDIEKKRPPRV